MIWHELERVKCSISTRTTITERSAVPGGWLVRTRTAHDLNPMLFYRDEHPRDAIVPMDLCGLTFVPDPTHAWGVP
jgi:hypothetical protein